MSDYIIDHTVTWGAVLRWKVTTGSYFRAQGWLTQRMLSGITSLHTVIRQATIRPIWPHQRRPREWAQKCSQQGNPKPTPIETVSTRAKTAMKTAMKACAPETKTKRVGDPNAAWWSQRRYFPILNIIRVPWRSPTPGLTYPVGRYSSLKNVGTKSQMAISTVLTLTSNYW